MKRQKGFSLIELLIVVAIILIIAAIAIPNLLRSRIAANEASAVASVRTLTTSEITYAMTYTDTGYSANLAALGGDATDCATPTKDNACLIDNSLALAKDAASNKSGYFFTITPANDGTAGSKNTDFVAGADPATAGTTGVRNFCSDSQAVLHQATTGTAPTDAATCDGLAVL